MFIRLILVLVLFLVMGCSDIVTHTNEAPESTPEESTETTLDETPEPTPEEPEPIPEELDPMAIIHITDFFSSALISAVSDLFEVEEDDTSINIVAPPPNTDAALRTFGDLLYIINRFGRDSIQIVDPSSSFDTILEFSTGGGTNPQDILILSDTRAYVTLYQPEATGSKEIIIVNPQTGDIIGGIDLTSLTDDDGEQLARPTKMVLINDEVWVLIQDLDGFYQVVTNGKIAVIGAETNSLIDTDPDEPGVQGIPLFGRNPNDIAYDSNRNLVYISNTGVFQPDFMTDLTDDFGGIEAIDPETYTSQGIVIDDVDLEGYPGRILISEDVGFVTSDSKRVASFDPVTFDVIDPNLYESPGTFLPDIALDGTGYLLITERGNFEGMGAGLVILDIENGFASQGPIDVGGPPNSIAIIEAP